MAAPAATAASLLFPALLMHGASWSQPLAAPPAPAASHSCNVSSLPLPPADQHFDWTSFPPIRLLNAFFAAFRGGAPGAIRDMHRGGVFDGSADIDHGRGPLVRALLRAAGMPPPGRAVPSSS